jgi:hypothetical protein
MSTPHGMKCAPRTLTTGDKVHIYSDAAHIILQIRHQVPSEDDLLGPSFKVAVSFTSAEAIAIASELLNVALPQLNQSLAMATIPEKDSLPFLNENESTTEGR